MFKKQLLSLLTLTVLLVCLITLGCSKKETPPTVGDALTSPVNSARALDYGDAVYYLDNDGSLWVSSAGSATLAADLSANQIALVNDCIWYASGVGLYSYAIESGKTELICSLPDAIDSFSVCSDGFYCLADASIYGSDGKLIVDLGTMNLADGNDLSTVERISMENTDEIVLYLPNPAYINEENAEVLPLSNDVYITYRYSLSSAKLDAIEQFKENAQSSASSSNGSYVINGVTLPFSDYPVGSYFTQDGGPCHCHAGDCISNNRSSENCMRYWPNKTNCQIDLRGVQCMGFARFCQWRLYGTHDFSNTTDFYNAFGKKLNAGSWTANTIKQTFTEVGPGGHIRTGAGHSLFVISVSASGFVTYECNTNNKDCKVYTRQWTWDKFFDYAGSRPLMYYNMPRDVNNSEIVTPPADEYKTGTYQVVANGGLNLRSASNTSSAILATIPQGSIINVSLVQQVGSYYWGYTQYEEQYGWVRLDYTLYQNSAVSGIHITTLPDKTSYTVGDSFSTEGMVVEATFTNGAAFEIAGYSCSGYNMSRAGTYTVTVRYGEFSDSFTIEVKERVIPPTSVALSESSVTLIVGDTLQLSYTILPADTTQKNVYWSASSSSVASIEGDTVSAHTPGSSTIKITTENGLTATCKVTVIAMPTGINWSTTADGQPLSQLPLGIRSEDFSIRYRLSLPSGWGDWIYSTPPESATDYQCQFRAFTATFVDTLDGRTVEQFTVEFNEIITFSRYPLSKAGYLFTGWYTDPQGAQSHDSSKACSSSVVITGDLLVYAGWIKLDSITADSSDPFAQGGQVSEFEMAGVELRVSDDMPGLRYLARISNDLIRELEALHASNQNFRPTGAGDTGIGFGMAVQLKSGLAGSLVKGNANYLNSGSAVTVPAYRTYASYNGYIIYNAFVCGFSEQYYGRDFVARPYITYADVNGNTHTYYFTCSGSNSTGGGYYTSLRAEAEKLIAAPATDEATKRWLQDNILG